MNAITYLEMSKELLCEDALDSFCRYQQVKRCWRKQNNEWVLVDNKFVEDWDSSKKRSIIADLKSCLDAGGVVFGAIDDSKIIGFASVSSDLFGINKEYVELLMIHVSNAYRSKGIGRNLFALIAESEKKMGAKKIYISAHSSEESQAFYRKIGCVDAVEINQVIAQNEPFDVQMEFEL